jgi:hypothetical protein
MPRAYKFTKEKVGEKEREKATTPFSLLEETPWSVHPSVHCERR